MRALMVGVAGAALAGVLYLWGPDLSFRIHLPVQAVLLDVFFMPGVMMVQSIAFGHPEPIYVHAAVLWPAVSLAAALLRLLVRLRGPGAWYGSRHSSLPTRTHMT